MKRCVYSFFLPLGFLLLGCNRCPDLCHRLVRCAPSLNLSYKECVERCPSLKEWSKEGGFPGGYERFSRCILKIPPSSLSCERSIFLCQAELPSYAWWKFLGKGK